MVINRFPSSSELDLQLSVCEENINRTGELLKNTLVASSKSQFNDDSLLRHLPAHLEDAASILRD